jgi:hypothetical protein
MADRSLASPLRKIKPAAALCAIATLLAPPTSLAQCAPPQNVMFLINWDHCVEHAVDLLYNQPEAAETVAKAANTCATITDAHLSRLGEKVAAAGPQ